MTSEELRDELHRHVERLESLLRLVAQVVGGADVPRPWRAVSLADELHKANARLISVLEELARIQRKERGDG